jgi:predicted ribosomally synthesized peptide with nif11-like leader
MSIENARQFLERMKTDEDFKKKVSRASSQEREKIIAEAGFDFIEEELEQVSGELTPDDLEQVAGGGGGIPDCEEKSGPCDTKGCQTVYTCGSDTCKSQCVEVNQKCSSQHLYCYAEGAENPTFGTQCPDYCNGFAACQGQYNQ